MAAIRNSSVLFRRIFLADQTSSQDGFLYSG
jgi:hypothetical protein